MDWDIQSASACVVRNGGKISGRQVSHPQPGLKILSAMDYLKNYCKFTAFIEPDKAEEVKEDTTVEQYPAVVVIKKRSKKLKEE